MQPPHPEPEPLSQAPPAPDPAQRMAEPAQSRPEAPPAPDPTQRMAEPAPTPAAPPAPNPADRTAPPAPHSPQEDPPPPPAGSPHATARVVETDKDATDGLAKCGRCGATDIALNPDTGMLRCSFCRYEWNRAKALDAFGLDGDIGALRGMTLGSGSTDIVPSTQEVLTFKCSACGAEVVIDTANSSQARCHWCRNKLSMNQQLPNGAVPDMILPFSMRRDEAVKKIAAFVKRRKFYAHPRFRREFNPANVMGVYLPYMVVDVNAHATLTGQGEHTTRTYTRRRGKHRERRYDADVYNIKRDFDIHVDDLTVESSSERLDQRSSVNSNNIINAIMPFDTENSVRYDANYLAGFTSERRDSNVNELMPRVQTQARDVTRMRANETLQFYDRGVRWDNEQLDVIGQRWVSAYLPVWLYSYFERKSNGKTFLHYVAVNARTGQTMGSVPINQPKLLLVSAAVQVVGTILFGLVMLLG